MWQKYWISNNSLYLVQLVNEKNLPGFNEMQNVNPLDFVKYWKLFCNFYLIFPPQAQQDWSSTGQGLGLHKLILRWNFNLSLNEPGGRGEGASWLSPSTALHFSLFSNLILGKLLQSSLGYFVCFHIETVPFINGSNFCLGLINLIIKKSCKL